MEKATCLEFRNGKRCNRKSTHIVNKKTLCAECARKMVPAEIEMFPVKVHEVFAEEPGNSHLDFLILYSKEGFLAGTNRWDSGREVRWVDGSPLHCYGF